MIWNRKTISPIRERINEIVDQKIASAEAQYEKDCDLADEKYELVVEAAEESRQNSIAEAEKAAVDSVIGKLL